MKSPLHRPGARSGKSTVVSCFPIAGLSFLCHPLRHHWDCDVAVLVTWLPVSLLGGAALHMDREPERHFHLFILSCDGQSHGDIASDFTSYSSPDEQPKHAGDAGHSAHHGAKVRMAYLQGTCLMPGQSPLLLLLSQQNRTT